MAERKDADDELLVRAVRVLEGLAGMQQPAPMAAVVDRTGLNKTQVYRALRALQQAGYVDHIGRRGYRVAARGISLGTVLSSRPELRELARPFLVRLADATSATVAFHLRNGHHRVLILAAVPPRRSTGAALGVRLGERSALTRGCAGRAILAHLDREHTEAVLKGLPPDDLAPTARELERIRQLGYALSFADNHAGVNGISVPVLDPEGSGPLGSITLSGDAERFDTGGLVGHLRPLQAAATELAPVLAATIGPGASTSRQALDIPPPAVDSRPPAEPREHCN